MKIGVVSFPRRCSEDVGVTREELRSRCRRRNSHETNLKFWRVTLTIQEREAEKGKALKTDSELVIYGNSGLHSHRETRIGASNFIVHVTFAPGANFSSMASRWMRELT